MGEQQRAGPSSVHIGSVKTALVGTKENVPNSRQTSNTSNDAYLVLQPLRAWAGGKVRLELLKTPDSRFVGNFWNAWFSRHV